MATLSSILAWKIPWTEERGELQSMGSNKVGHNWVHTPRTYTAEREREVKSKWKLLSCVRLCVTPWTIQSMEFSRPEYWSGWPFSQEFPGHQILHYGQVFNVCLPGYARWAGFIFLFFIFYVCLFFKNWSIIALQCCVTFCCTRKWTSCM